MYRYYFRIADVNIVFLTEYPVSWPDNMLPFSIGGKDIEETDLLENWQENDLSETEHEEIKHERIKYVKTGISCFLRVSSSDTGNSSHNSQQDRKAFKKRDRKLLKTIPFGSRQENHEIHFYCLQYRKSYLVEYPSILLQEGVLFRRDNISGYLGLEFILMDFDCFWLHASCVLWKEEGLVFSAPSGTGKSTQAKLWETWREAEIVNGDRILIRRITTAEYKVYGSPFAGSSHIYKQKNGTLTAIFLLKQFCCNKLEKLSPAQTFLRIYGEALHCPENGEYTEALQQLVKSMVLELPILELRCTPDERAVSLVADFILQHCI